MAMAFVEFDLKEGFVQNWLAGGPQEIALKSDLNTQEASSKAEIADQFDDEKLKISGQPVERGPLERGNFQIGSYKGQWDYYRCREDHFVDHSTKCSQLTYLRSWVFSQLQSPTEQTAQVTVTAFGPVDIWNNKKRVYHSDVFAEQLNPTTFQMQLVKGANKIFVQFAGIADPECKLVMALKVEGEGITVRIPTLIPSLERRNQLEAINELIYLDRDVYAAMEQVYLIWPEEIPLGEESASYQDARLQTLKGKIYANASDVGKPGQKLFLGDLVSLPQGPMHALVMPRDWEYYELQIRITKELDLFVMGNNRFSNTIYGTSSERSREALLDAAYHENDVFAELAKMALGAWLDVDQKFLMETVKAVEEHQADSEVKLLGLLSGLIRFGDNPKFPEALKKRIEASVPGYAYGQDSAKIQAVCDEGRAMVLHTCEILAGQLFPEMMFDKSGMTGQQHREKGEEQASAWMTAHGTQGFVAWDSKEVYEEAIAALAHLVDLSESEAVWELASVSLDKIFFTIALNSHQGVFGSTQGCSRRTQVLKSGLLDATAGTTRVMWGMGVFNQNTLGSVSTALMHKYELPPIIAEIASMPPEEVWSQEQSGEAGATVNKATYRTPDYMLSSAQDYRPGEQGDREHIWQATLGPECVVFTNYPGSATEKDAHTPNFWLGNASLPRVAQYQDTLIAIYQAPEAAWLDFTHAYFLSKAFDDYRMDGSTLFARKGDGYLALTTMQGLEMSQSGWTTYRELRSNGRQNIWVCQMGRAATDGGFAAFQEKVLANKPQFDQLNVEVQTLRGEKLSFGWDRPFLRDGVEQPLSGYNLYENIYTNTPWPSPEVEIRTENYLLRMRFGEAEGETE